MTEIRNEPLRRMPNTALIIHNRLSRTFSYDLPLEKKRKMETFRMFSDPRWVYYAGKPPDKNRRSIDLYNNCKWQQFSEITLPCSQSLEPPEELSSILDLRCPPSLSDAIRATGAFCKKAEQTDPKNDHVNMQDETQLWKKKPTTKTTLQS